MTEACTTWTACREHGRQLVHDHHRAALDSLWRADSRDWPCGRHRKTPAARTRPLAASTLLNLLSWRAQRWGRYAPSRGAQLEQWRRTLQEGPRRSAVALPRVAASFLPPSLSYQIEPRQPLKVSLQLPSLTKLYLLQPPSPCIPGYAELPMSSSYNNGCRRPLLPSPFSTFRPSKTGLGLHGDPTRCSQYHI